MPINKKHDKSGNANFGIHIHHLTKQQADPTRLINPVKQPRIYRANDASAHKVLNQKKIFRAVN